MMPAKVLAIEICPKSGFNRKVCFCARCKPNMTLAEAQKLVKAIGGR